MQVAERIKPLEAMELLLGRSSAPLLTEPAPTEEALELMLQSAVRAPDHGQLRPWRFVAVREGQRARFGDLLADHLKRKRPDATPEVLDLERRKAQRAPLILVACCRVGSTDRIPRIEQMLSAGAAAHAVLLAAQALGYGGIWKTGSAAYDEEVKQAFGLEPKDAIIGFIYLGTPLVDPPDRGRPDFREHLESWRE